MASLRCPEINLPSVTCKLCSSDSNMRWLIMKGHPLRACRLCLEERRICISQICFYWCFDVFILCRWHSQAALFSLKCSRRQTKDKSEVIWGLQFARDEVSRKAIQWSAIFFFKQAAF